MRITLTRTGRVVTCDVGEVSLPDDEFNLLWLLALAAPGALPRQALIAATSPAAPGSSPSPDHTVVSDVVRAVRASLSSIALEGLVVTERGVGYRVEALPSPAGTDTERVVLEGGPRP